MQESSSNTENKAYNGQKLFDEKLRAEWTQFLSHEIMRGTGLPKTKCSFQPGTSLQMRVFNELIY